MTEHNSGPVTDHGAPAEPPDPPAKVLPPRLGGVVSGVLSFFLSASLLVAAPLGLIIAPFGLVPMVRFISSGQRSVLAWGWVVFVLAAFTRLLPEPWALTTAILLVIYTIVIVLPLVSIELWLRLGWTEGRWVAVATGAVTVISIGSVVTLTTLDTVAQSPLEIVRYFELLPFYNEMASQLAQSQGTLIGGYDLAGIVSLLLAWLLPSIVSAYFIAVLFWIRPRLPMLALPVRVGLFERYRSEEWLPAAFAAAGIATLLLDGTLRWCAANLLAVVLWLYFVHGLAIIRAHLSRWIGRGWFVRWGVALLCLQVPLPMLMVVALGLADSFYQLRPQVSENGRKP